MAPRIEPGDYIAVCPDICCNNKDIVAFRFVNDDKVTLKRYIQQGSTIILQPENPQYSPIVVTEEIELLGKVVYIIKKVKILPPILPPPIDGETIIIYYKSIKSNCGGFLCQLFTLETNLTIMKLR